MIEMLERPAAHPAFAAPVSDLRLDLFHRESDNSASGLLCPTAVFFVADFVAVLRDPSRSIRFTALLVRPVPCKAYSAVALAVLLSPSRACRLAGIRVRRIVRSEIRLALFDKGGVGLALPIANRVEAARGTGRDRRPERHELGATVLAGSLGFEFATGSVDAASDAAGFRTSHHPTAILHEWLAAFDAQDRVRLREFPATLTLPCRTARLAIVRL